MAYLKLIAKKKTFKFFLPIKYVRNYRVLILYLCYIQQYTSYIPINKYSMHQIFIYVICPTITYTPENKQWLRYISVRRLVETRYMSTQNNRALIARCITPPVPPQFFYCFPAQRSDVLDRHRSSKKDFFVVHQNFHNIVVDSVVFEGDRQ